MKEDMKRPKPLNVAVYEETKAAVGEKPAYGRRLPQETICGKAVKRGILLSETLCEEPATSKRVKAAARDRV